MPFAPSNSSNDLAGVSRPMVQALFVASCLLSVVSWYTTFEGMRLYLSVWFSVLASVGLQTALVLVAWLIGFSSSLGFSSPATRHAGRRALLIGVYVVTAIVSIAFSYTSLYTWFSARERPASIERKLYDALNGSAGQTSKLLTSAIGEQQKHVLALQEMTEAEKTHGLISRAQDADPYLANVRAAVAREAQTYAENYKEGAGAGIRYSAFDRYTKLAEQSWRGWRTRKRNWLALFQTPGRSIPPKSSCKLIDRSMTMFPGMTSRRRFTPASSSNRLFRITAISSTAPSLGKKIFSSRSRSCSPLPPPDISSL
jgi:hypothetical protein